MRKQNVLYILTNGRVAAINKKDGAIVWEIKLKEYVKSSMLSGIGQIVNEGDKLYIGISGILICLSAKDGSLVWKNELKGWGYNFISMANTSTEAAGAATQAAASAALIASTAG
ncbi:MAG TPA: PQQ-binding-like beta-propeller repeat protein [Ferruginibacter sp.]|nr:PQQ-binding-like beta-propeller repeat protein [Ferruginibacter sp.]HPH90017.1 PQQ-binding-like beta-propeller repeat protein [Ferruginibacter sp.]